MEKKETTVVGDGSGKESQCPLGLTIFEPKTGYVRIRAVKSGSPAEEAGLAPGALHSITLSGAQTIQITSKAEALQLLRSVDGSQEAISICWTPNAAKRGRPSGKVSEPKRLKQMQDRDSKFNAEATDEQRQEKSKRRQQQRENRFLADWEAHRDAEKTRYQAKSPAEKKAYSQSVMATRAARGLTTKEPDEAEEKKKKFRGTMDPRMWEMMEKAGYKKEEWEEDVEIGHKQDDAEMAALSTAFANRFTLSAKERKKVEEAKAERERREEAAERLHDYYQALWSQFTHDGYIRTREEDGPYDEAISRLFGVPLLETEDSCGRFFPSHPRQILNFSKKYRFKNSTCFDVKFEDPQTKKTLSVTVLQVLANSTRHPLPSSGTAYDVKIWEAETEARLKDNRAEDLDSPSITLPEKKKGRKKIYWFIKSSWKPFPSGAAVEAVAELANQELTASKSGGQILEVPTRFFDTSGGEGTHISEYYVGKVGHWGFDFRLRDTATGRKLTIIVVETTDEDEDADGGENLHDSDSDLPGPSSN